MADQPMRGRKPTIDEPYRITIILDRKGKGHLYSEWRKAIMRGERVTLAETARRIFHEHEELKATCPNSAQL